MRAQSPAIKYRLLCFCRNIAAALILLWLLPPPQSNCSSRLLTSTEARIVTPVAEGILLPEMVANREATPGEDTTGHQEVLSGPKVDLVNLSHLQRSRIRKVHLGNRIIKVAI